MSDAVTDMDWQSFTLLIPGARWGRPLNAFNDILRAGFGTPEAGFIVKSVNSLLSRERLDDQMSVRQLGMRLGRADRTYRPRLRTELESARNHVEPTVFDRIVDIIRNHGPAGK
ncbi:MAG: barnase inhibitor [Phycisphaerae bacterium]|nr:barnase inhibitor [Phycisphaerae bacterium]NUQ45013.1 barnase inhibitor [Phycisphaerae bacterium]